MLAYKINSREIVNQIFIPKYYDPELKRDLSFLEESHSLLSLGDLLDAGDITVQTGHEIGKMAYGTGNIPFVRTSDITNWEIKTISNLPLYKVIIKSQKKQIWIQLFFLNNTELEYMRLKYHRYIH